MRLVRRSGSLGLLSALLVLAASSSALATAGTTSTTIAGGWGKNVTTYIGKYTVAAAGTHSADPSGAELTTTVAAGVFSQVVRTAAEIDAGANAVTSGALVTFIRKVKTGEPLQPSGILSLFGPSGSQVVYLTDMARRGAQRVATVNGGSFLGPSIGMLTATPAAQGTLDAVIKASGLGTVHVRLTHFIAAPPTA